MIIVVPTEVVLLKDELDSQVRMEASRNAPVTSKTVSSPPKYTLGDIWTGLVRLLL